MIYINVIYFDNLYKKCFRGVVRGFPLNTLNEEVRLELRSPTLFDDPIGDAQSYFRIISNNAAHLIRLHPIILCHRIGNANLREL